MTLLLVALGAAVGAPTRYLADRFVRSRLGPGFPWGTLLVNVVGSALLGFLTALPVSSGLGALLGTGFCGALTTYSTFGYETLRLARTGARGRALMYVAASALLGVSAAVAAAGLA
ncbi:fluoride efflux transporter FluC [Virgisporangium aurantiacum]|uniref:Fluoride-specific ion channel FluC n=1 Tax=Virgisporangium aurantiacum TaxID=175570 RepID=A0A8J3Z2D7_9ACTN|nr:CrcB family protein [Virgisporangium aurantiacum]GIJ55053.1 putative fluoride ion transporter CrcB 2 [Virgisporangium aurantiacum]